MIPAAAFHPRPAAVVVLIATLSVALIALVPRLPSRAAALAAGVGAGGAIGNAIGASAWSGGVPDPFVLAGVAFNLADVFALAGAGTLFAATAVYVARHPANLRHPI